MTGLERLLADPRSLAGARRIGLLTNPTGVTRSLEPSAVALRRAGLPLERLFAPEHGIDGSGQAGEAPERGADSASGLPVTTLYKLDLPAITRALEGLDAIIIDLQDVGTRFYTYLSTLHLVLQAAADEQRIIVLDRPNPLGFEEDGPVLDERLRSFVGTAALPLRHGLTLGEAARFLDGGTGLVEVIPCDPDEPFGVNSLPWVPPSPNLPTLTAAVLYPGLGLLEGSSLSEGRGTTLPFQMVGGPGVNAPRLAARLNDLGRPGVRFRPAWFTPSASKHAGALCTGVQLHLTGSPSGIVETGLLVLAALVEQVGSLNLPWLSSLLGKPVEAKDITTAAIPKLCAVWALERADLAESWRRAWLYPR